MSSPGPRVVLVNYGGDFAATVDPESILQELRTLTDWAEAVSAAGAAVAVVQGAHRDARLTRGGIDYRFVAGPFSPYLSRRRVPWRLHRIVHRLRPEVVHLNGLLYGLQARLLRRSLPAGCPLVMQHHGERPDRGAAAMAQRWGLRAADGFFFTAREMADEWRSRGLIGRSQPVFPILEGSSRLRPQNRSEARAVSGLKGRPIFLWAGNLDANKDPLTVLTAFEGALDELPEARLYMAWRRQSLLPEVRRRIAESPGLNRAVELLGTLRYDRLGPIFNSADYLLQGSHRESCGFAVADAMACGTFPIVTDIPPFRVLTANGTLGTLWPRGDAEALRRAIRATARQPIASLRQATRRFFERNLSFQAIGEQALAAYRQLPAPGSD